MASAFFERLLRVKRRREAIANAIRAVYDLVPEGKVRRLEVAREVAAIMKVPTVSPQFQVDVHQVALSLGARKVAKGNARFFRGLQRRATCG